MKHFISIVIPFAKPNELTFRCVENCFRQSYSDYEIILLPDNKLSSTQQNNIEKLSKTSGIKCLIIQTGKKYPSVKRNIGIKKSQGSIIAFIDDDAIPPKDWLSIGEKFFHYEKLGALGGPASPSQDSNARELAADYIIKSRLGTQTAYGMKYKNLNIKGKTYKVMEASELPTCNLLASKEVLVKVKMFDESMHIVEDAELCHKIIAEGKQILFYPGLSVIHRSRPLFFSMMKRIFDWATYRTVLGFMKKDLKPLYFIPSLFVVGLIAGFILSFLSQALLIAYIAVLAVYIVAVILNGMAAPKGQRILAILGMPLIHIAYGLGFLYGFSKVKK